MRHANRAAPAFYKSDFMNTSTKPLLVEVWSDFVCPWCWIAKRRFDKALAAFEHRDLVQVNLRAYRIAANYQPESFAAALLRKFRDPAAAQGMMDAVRQHGAAEGLDYRFDTMQFGDTIDAHMLVKAVEDEALQKLLVEALYEQSVTHGASLFDRSSLAQIATQAGVSAQLVQDAWAAPGLRQLVQRDERTAANVASGVPLFLFGDGSHVSGAQPQNVFAEALDRLYHRSQVAVPDLSGQVCGLDGCSI